MADHLWIEKGNHLTLWDKVKIFDRDGRWKRRRLKKEAHVLGHVDHLSRPSMEMNTIGTPRHKITLVC